MGTESLARSPARMAIANVATGDSITAQFNPTELEQALEVTWARATVPGLSHQPLQFVNTGNTKLTLTLTFDALEPSADVDQLGRAQRFLLSLCYPRRGAQDIASGAPPRVLFVWPNTVSLTCVLTALSFTFTRFRSDGAPIQFSARVGLEEIRDVRLTSEDVLANGSLRANARARTEG